MYFDNVSTRLLEKMFMTPHIQTSWRPVVPPQAGLETSSGPSLTLLTFNLSCVQKEFD